MDLKTYLERHSTQQTLAGALGVSQSLVSQWISDNPKNKTKITAERATQIEEATGGLVTRHELRPDIFDVAHTGTRRPRTPATAGA